jgi:FKBP-type peptidyl-prolyl cis-trans isomerase
MTQTVNGQKGTQQPQKQYRPGQRKQERLIRHARRRRQRMIILGSILGVVLIALAGVGYWQFPRFIALLHHVPVTNACSIDHSDAKLYASLPASGRANPPVINTSPGMFANGLQCIDLKVGSGTAAQIGSVVSIQYTAWIAATNLEFDSTFDRHAKPYQILLGGKAVISGLEQGLSGMKAGSIRRLIIPPSLGYGDAGHAPRVPGGATLIFDVIVQSINNCAVATGSNFYNSASSSSTVIGPVLPSGPTTPPPVTTTPGTMLDGLQCIDLKVGTGTPVQALNTVSVQYTGWLEATGKKFDSSYDRGGTPLTVQVGLGKIIRGFDQGLIGMRVGGTRRLIIPAALAYGSQGQPPTIPPNSVLIFDITLVSL